MEPGQPEPERQRKLWEPPGLAHACSGLSALGTALPHHITEPGALGGQKRCLEASQESEAITFAASDKSMGLCFLLLKKRCVCVCVSSEVPGKDINQKGMCLTHLSREAGPRC